MANRLSANRVLVSRHRKCRQRAVETIPQSLPRMRRCSLPLTRLTRRQIWSFFEALVFSIPLQRRHSTRQFLGHWPLLIGYAHQRPSFDALGLDDFLFVAAGLCIDASRLPGSLAPAGTKVTPVTPTAKPGKLSSGWPAFVMDVPDASK